MDEGDLTVARLFQPGGESRSGEGAVVHQEQGTWTLLEPVVFETKGIGEHPEDDEAATRDRGEGGAVELSPGPALKDFRREDLAVLLGLPVIVVAAAVPQTPKHEQTGSR
ncbi:MAG TPA: hypothetical protein VLE27_12430 [Thermoanaerobaculia bacterium]|nr:hypothetical protein [Thermoanaerobaculia bacterium]